MTSADPTWCGRGMCSMMRYLAWTVNNSKCVRVGKEIWAKKHRFRSCEIFDAFNSLQFKHRRTPNGEWNITRNNKIHAHYMLCVEANHFFLNNSFNFRNVSRSIVRVQPVHGQWVLKMSPICHRSILSSTYTHPSRLVTSLQRSVKINQGYRSESIDDKLKLYVK